MRPGGRTPSIAGSGGNVDPYCDPIRALPVNQIDAKAVLRVLEPIWNDKPETASRLRGRIEVILAAAQVKGWIDPNPP